MFTGIGFTILCLSKIYQGIYFDFWRRSERVKKCLKNLKRGNVSDTETAIDQVNSLVPLQREFFLFTHGKTIDVHTLRTCRKTYRFFLASFMIHNLNLEATIFFARFSRMAVARKTPFYLLTNRFNTATIAELVSSSLFLSREQRRRIYVGSYAKPSPPPPLRAKTISRSKAS